MAEFWFQKNHWISMRRMNWKGSEWRQRGGLAYCCKIMPKTVNSQHRGNQKSGEGGSGVDAEVMVTAQRWYSQCLKCRPTSGRSGVVPGPCTWRMVLELTNKRGRRGAQVTFCGLLISGLSWEGSLVLCSSVNRRKVIALLYVHLHKKKGGWPCSLRVKNIGQAFPAVTTSPRQHPSH